jgi:hypothetical protein
MVVPTTHRQFGSKVRVAARMRNAVKTEAALLNYPPPARTLFCEAAE